MPSPTPAKRTGTSKDQEAPPQICQLNYWSDEGWAKIFPPLREAAMRQLLVRVGENRANEGLSHTSSLDLHRPSLVFLWRFAGT